MLAVLAFAPLAQVMILGTYHFADAGRDVVKTDLRDPLSATRQKEIAELTRRLESFRPTKIAIEATADQAESINQRLAAYVNGTYELSPNEIEQIGFRLAKAYGLSRLTAIDTHLDLDFGRLFQFLGQHDPARAATLSDQMQQIGRKFQAWDARYSVGQMLAIHNSQPYIKESQRFYVSLCSDAKSSEFPGADILGDWYKRNARIYGNLRNAIQPGDRVLVIYGSGHLKILQQLVQDSGDLELVQASKYLPRCPVSPEELRFLEPAITG
jgi:hypothetical protein